MTPFRIVVVDRAVQKLCTHLASRISGPEPSAPRG